MFVWFQVTFLRVKYLFSGSILLFLIDYNFEYSFLICWFQLKQYLLSLLEHLVRITIEISNTIWRYNFISTEAPKTLMLIFCADWNHQMQVLALFLFLWLAMQNYSEGCSVYCDQCQYACATTCNGTNCLCGGFKECNEQCPPGTFIIRQWCKYLFRFCCKIKRYNAT